MTYELSSSVPQESDVGAIEQPDRMNRAAIERMIFILFVSVDDVLTGRLFWGFE